MFQRFMALIGQAPGGTILDVGVTSDTSYASSNYLEAWYPHSDAITAAGIDDARHLEADYPGVRFVRANGLMLPFADRAFDVVHAAAVLEHVGSLDNQIKFVAECARIANKAIFLTTPNRWFPVEVHTALPLLHWLPKPLFRRALAAMGLGFFAEEANLNLLSRGDMLRIAERVEGFKFSMAQVSVLYWPSNLCLIGRRWDQRDG